MSDENNIIIKFSINFQTTEMKKYLSGSIIVKSRALVAILFFAVFALSVQSAFAADFDKGKVSLSFDDGLKSVFENAMPILNDRGLKTTQYINSGPALGATLCGGSCYTNFMSFENILALFGGGHDIGAHTRSHINLTNASTTEIFRSEIYGDRLDILNRLMLPVNSLAYPYGASSEAVVDELKTAGYTAARLVDNTQLNTTSTNPFALFGRQVLSNTSTSTVKAWIDEAATNKQWLILVFHQNTNDCAVAGLPDGDIYCNDIPTLTDIADYLVAQQTAGSLDVITVSQGLSLLDNHPTSGPLSPVITQSDISVSTTSANGTQVAFLPTVTDPDSSSASTLKAFCTIPNDIQDPISGLAFPTPVISGTTFPIGTTTVTCKSADLSGNTGTMTFNVGVTQIAATDTLAPVISGAVDTTVFTGTNASTAVSFSPTATDNVDASVSVSCNPVSGSLFAVGSTTVTCTATDSALNTATSTFAVGVVYVPDAVTPGIEILPASLLSGVVGTFYTSTLTASTTAAGPFTWTVSLGSIPAGLTLDSGTAVLSGTPTTVGNYNFSVFATNGSASTTKAYSVAISAGTVATTTDTLTITTPSLPDAIIGTPYNQAIVATPASATPFSWQILSGGTLPGGLELSSTTGVISGTTGSTGQYSFFISVSNGTSTTTKAFTINSNTAASATPAPVTSGGGGGGAGGNGPIFGGTTFFGGQVLGASTSGSATSSDQISQLKLQLAGLYKQVIALQFRLSECVEVLNSDLSEGMNTPDVFSLQQALNSSTFTRVAATGNGSLGKETNFFGNLTKVAVIKFQNFFADEILAPMGLTSGDGIVGTTTRAQINKLCSVN